MTPELDETIATLDRLRRQLAKAGNRQVRSLAERREVQTAVAAWFTKRRAGELASAALDELDEGFRRLLEFAEANTTRARYLETIKELKRAAVAARSDYLLSAANARDESFEPPDFSPLVHDEEMRRILRNR